MTRADPVFGESGRRYMVAIAPSSRASCKAGKKCDDKAIHKGEVRFGSSSDSDSSKGAFLWRHISCMTATVLKNAAEEYGNDLTQIPGVADLETATKAYVIKTHVCSFLIKLLSSTDRYTISVI
jgi:hypothetical protein